MILADCTVSYIRCYKYMYMYVISCLFVNAFDPRLEDYRYMYWKDCGATLPCQSSGSDDICPLWENEAGKLY